MVASSSSDVDVAADRIAKSYPPICKDLLIDIRVSTHYAQPAPGGLDAVFRLSGQPLRSMAKQQHVCCTEADDWRATKSALPCSYDWS